MSDDTNPYAAIEATAAKAPPPTTAPDTEANPYADIEAKNRPAPIVGTTDAGGQIPDDPADVAARSGPGATPERPVYDAAQAAPAKAIARASLAAEPELEKQRYSEFYKQPIEDFSVHGDKVIRKTAEGRYVYAEPPDWKAGLESPQKYVASGVGQAIPMAAGAGAGALAGLATAETGPGAFVAATAAHAAGGAGGEIIRQSMDRALAPDATPMDWANVGWQALQQGLGPLGGKAMDVAGKGLVGAGKWTARTASAAAGKIGDMIQNVPGLQGLVAQGKPIVQNVTQAVDDAGQNLLGLTQEARDAVMHHLAGKFDDIKAGIQNARDNWGIDLSIGQATQSPVMMQAERQQARFPWGAEGFAERRKAQNEDQIPGAMGKFMDEVSPVAGGEAQISGFRDAADTVVDQGLKARSQAARPLYDQAMAGGRTAPLEDQFKQAVIQATSGKGQIAKQMKAIETNNAGALASRGAAGADIRARYMDLAQQASEAEEARQAMLDRLARAKADKTAEAPGAVWNPRIQQFLDDPVLQSGLKRGIEIQRLEALAEGRPFNPTEYAITGTDESGKPIVGAVPNMRTLDTGKKGLDAIIKDNTNDFGQKNQYAGAVDKVRRAYLSEIDMINPDYAPARAKWGTDTDALDAVRDGGIGFINNMSGPDRQNMVGRVFSGQNLLPEEISRMRGQFAKAGKLPEWNAGVRAHLQNALDTALTPTQGGEASNVGGKLYRGLWGTQRQENVIKAALGNDEKLMGRWNSLGDALQRAAHQLPEGSPTATDTAAQGTAGMLKKGMKAIAAMSHPAGAAVEGLADYIEKMQTPEARRQIVNYMLTTDGDAQLRALQSTMNASALPKGQKQLLLPPPAQKALGAFLAAAAAHTDTVQGTPQEPAYRHGGTIDRTHAALRNLPRLAS